MERSKYLTLAESALVFGVIGAITGGVCWILIAIWFDVDMDSALPPFEDGQTWRLPFLGLFAGIFTFAALVLWFLCYAIFIPWREWHDSS